MTIGLELKGDVINDMFSRIGISGITSNPTNDERTRALLRLEAMMADFDINGIVVSYNFEDAPDLGSPTGVDDTLFDMMSSNLAIRMLSYYGMTPRMDLQNIADSTLSNASALTAIIGQVQYPNRQPRGHGSTLRFNRWSRFYRPQTRIDTELNSPFKDQQNITIVPESSLNNDNLS